jgi:hypothetical protein
MLGRATYIMRSMLTQLLLISTLAIGSAFAQAAQNSDLSFLAGPQTSTAQVVKGVNASVSASGGIGFQVNFAYTIHSYSFADLWIESPTVIVWNGAAYVSGSGTVSATDHNFSIWAPGVRFHVPVGSRFSFYGATGVGWGSFAYDEATVGPGVSVTSRRTQHGVFDFGGGMDFRLTRLLSLRGEVRDYVTGRGLGGVNGRNHPIYVFGVAFHF